MLLSRRLFAGAAVAAIAAATAVTFLPPSAGATIEAAKPAFGTWGFDLAGMDTSVKPADDFFRYANGNWLKTTEIPADRTRWGTFDILAVKAEEDLKVIIEALTAAKPAAGTEEAKVADFYATFLDRPGIDAQGFAPSQPILDLIRGAKSHEDLATLYGRPDVPGGAVIGFGISPDQKDPNRYTVTVSQSGLGLPDRDFYLKTDERSVEIREKYVTYLTTIFTAVGWDDPAGTAKALLDLETKIAELHWERARSRDRSQTYNLKTADELATSFAPEFPWAVMFTEAGLGQHPSFVLRQHDAIQKLAKLFRETPVSLWQAHMTARFLTTTASVQPSVIDDANFAFYAQTLNGQEQQRDRWKRAISAVNGALGEAVGELYVAKHFPPDSKAKMLDLVENVRKAYGERIRELPWMTEETKQVALKKLEVFRPKIGYPDEWLDYSKLEVKAGDALGNFIRANVFEWNREVERINKPTDRDEWLMTPQTVNAYYRADFNEITFPAAILQPPFFDPNADPAINYGAIGGVIGHEMGHGFDDQGSKSDYNGILRTWWNEKDEANFKSLVDMIVRQYSAYEPLPGLRLNGALGAGENIADVGGLSVSFRAYQLSLNGQPAPVLDGFTGEQRVFLGWAQAWRVVYREQALRTQVMTGPHSPGEFRVNGVVRNIDGWYDAFGVEQNGQMYVPTDQRVRIW